MKAQVLVPEVGESITEGVLVTWLAKDGSFVRVDDPLFELETDKITMTVTAEASGRLKTGVAPDSVVKVGQQVALIDTDATGGATAGDPAPATGVNETPSSAPSSGATPVAAAPEVPAISQPAGVPQMRQKLAASEAAELAPAVRRLVQEHGIDPSQVAASGRGGRLTKEDVVQFMEQPPAVLPETPSASASISGATPSSVQAASNTAGIVDTGSRQTRSTMSPLRHRIAERLVHAQQTAAILTTFNEVDMSQVMALRSKYKTLFKEKHGVGLGFMSFFVKAVVDALQTVPALNAQIQGDQLVQNHYYDIGVAVGTPKGLVVPVVRDVDRLSLAQIEVSIAELARRAREMSLQLSDLSGGVFTISNGGVYGSLLSTPILNPPQSGILGMHGIKKRPVVVDDEIVIRPMMYLAVSYDHRLVDGQEAVTFLKRIVECLEEPERLMLEV